MRKRNGFFTAIVLACFVPALYAGTRDVAVLYSGNTSTNADAIHFMERQFADLSQYRIVPTTDPRQIAAGRYDAVIVLNTGLASGVDRRLASFIASNKDTTKIVLVSLLKGSRSVAVSVYSPAPANLGVGAVSAASAWTGRGAGFLFGGKNSPEYEMHLEWVRQVISLIDGTK